MNTNTSAVLIAAAFTMIGFTLGRVTAPHGPGGHMGKMKMHHMMQGEHGMPAGVRGIVDDLEASDFEGDTIISIPGGEIHLIHEGETFDVKVDMESNTGSSEATWISEDGGEVVVEKMIVISTDSE